jgi:6-phosphogluconolactonase
MKAVGVAALLGVLAVAVLVLPLTAADEDRGGVGGVEAIFQETNGVSTNQIVAYEASSTGTLTWVGNFGTGGTGTGAALASSGSLALSSNHRWLLAVDAGSSQLSVLRVDTQVGATLLTLTDTVSSGGALPVSVAVSGSTVYVLNDGTATTPGNIVGFTLSGSGHLTRISGSSQPLSSSGATGAAEIAFNPAGNVLVVTEKATNVLDVYTVNGRGVARGPTSYPSQGTTPYGFAFSGSRHIVVSEATTGSASSYTVSRSHGLKVVSASVSDLNGAPCWVVVSANGRIAFVSNTHSDTISTYSVSKGGALTLTQSVAASTQAGPADMALGSNGQFLYVYDGGAPDLQAFHVGTGGSLSLVQTVTGLTTGTEGLVAT